MNEEEKFVIGEFTFDTFHEYRDAQEDLQKIECINQELDVHDPEVAVRLYNKIRAGEIKFKSPIGEQFFSHIADIVADKSVGLLEDKAVVDQAEGQVKRQRVAAIAIMIAAVLIFVYFGYAVVSDYVTTRKLKNLQNQVTEQNNISNDTQAGDNSTDVFEEKEKIDPSTLTVLSEYEGLVEQNSDMVGWLTIQGTDIDYPVMQKSEDNEYYLNRNFDGEEDSNGSLFMDYRSDFVNPTTNTIIYGHNMKNGMMFGQLKKYLDEDFYNDHKTIVFNTIYEKRVYEVQIVGLSEVEYQDENNFRYYDFIQADDTSNFASFLASINSQAVYGDTTNINTSDELLTLSTCNNYTNDGRLFVVAKRLN